MLSHSLGKPPVAVHITEVELPSGRQNSIRLAEHSLLVWAEVHDAIANDEVHRLVQDASLIQALDLALHKPHVRLPEAERVAVLLRVLPRNLCVHEQSEL